MWHLVFFLFFHLQLIISSPLNSSSSPSANKLCSPEQSFALLHFKNSTSFYKGYCDSSVNIDSWKEESDCCSWYGVTCDTYTGHVIGLDLSYSCLSGTINANSSLFLLHHLQVLKLHFTGFSGELPDTIGNLKYLKVLDLSQRRMIPGDPTWIVGNFTGQVPTSISKLGELTSLNLEGNKFSGQIPDVFDNLTKLTHLQVATNNFSGRLPSSAFNLPRISTLDFSENQFEGQIPCQVSGFSLPSLQILYLQNNKLSSLIPNSILDLVNLIELDLSSNNLNGTLNSDMFSKLQNVQRIDFSSNNLSGILNSHMFSKLQNVQKIDFSHNNHLSLSSCSNANFSLPNLEEFSFSSCNLSEVPMFLRYAKNLRELDLSNNKISGKIYGYELEFWKYLQYLNLSHNFLTSFDRIPLIIHLEYLDLRSNLLQGPLFDLSTDQMAYLLLSNNQLTGEIPLSFCNFINVVHLSLSNNCLNGTIPQCLGKLGNLEILNLQMNNFRGNIPQSFAQSSVLYLNLNGNQLGGQLPLFDNSSRLQVLDVGNNKINDTFPHCLASLPELEVLILRSNRFHGPIGNSTTIFHFQMLRILDLSHNQFNGHLPTRYFANFNALMQGSDYDVYSDYMGRSARYLNLRSEYEYYATTLTVKGVNMHIDRILTIFTAMDLSSNLFQGGIPTVIGNLNSLKLLNLSHNKLTGHIPSSFENLTELEALDLSSNKLNGDIPLQLAGLTFLALLNLSYNQLKGPIPKGKQFDTFQNDSYMGNLGLCGLPLSKKCGPEPPGPTIFHKEDDSLSCLDWKVTMMGYGCGLVIGLSIGYIVFATRRPQWFVRMVERKQSQMVRRPRGRIGGRRN